MKTQLWLFFDENLVDEFDEVRSDDEERRKIIGKVDKILVVIYNKRNL